jgi:DNA-directed RNA polymerase subunit M/transcription elongation factor TFIIS
MAKRKEYRYKGPAYLRPCGRGITVQSNREPYEPLDEEILNKLGIETGDFYIEIIARPKPPKDFKPKKAPSGSMKDCPACGGKMSAFYDSEGNSWECRTCGHSEIMFHAAHMSHCNRGENVGTCKYGDRNCPALSGSVAEEVTPKCEDDGCDMERGGPALDTHKEYWRCPECGWSFDID